MKLLYRRLRNEAGFALPMALVLLLLGGLIIIPTLALMSTNLTATRMIEEKSSGFYAADAGMEDAIWKLKSGEDPFSESTSYVLGETINEMTITVEQWEEPEETEDGTLYTIKSTASLGGETKGEVIAQALVGSGDSSAFDNTAVSLNGDITLKNNAKIYSDGGGEGDAYANGNIKLYNNASIDDDANATGTITTLNDSHIDGDSNPGAAPIDADALNSAMNELIDAWKAETQDTGCGATMCGSYTYTGDWWTPDAGTYTDPQHAKKNMSIDEWSGTWIFQDKVCVGVNTNKYAYIEGSPQVTFQGPFKVGKDLYISGWGSTVTFEDIVCVGRHIYVEDGATVEFQGKVQVGTDLKIMNSSDVTFGDTVYVGDDMTIKDSAEVDFGGTVYVIDNIIVENTAQVTGGQTIIADDNIQLKNDSSIVYAGLDWAEDDIPYIISTTGNITLQNNNVTTAILYAPDGDGEDNGNIKLYNNSKLTGAAIGRTIYIKNNAEIEYPEALRDRDDLPGGGGGEDGIQIQTYTIQ